MSKDPVPGRIVPPKRPRSIPGIVTEIQTGCGSVFVTITVDEAGFPLEAFATGMGACLEASMAAVGRVTSIALRCGVDPVILSRHLMAVSCTSVAWDNGKAVPSCFAAIGQAIQEVTEKAVAEAKASVEAITEIATPDDPEAQEAARETEKLRAERERQGLNE